MLALPTDPDSALAPRSRDRAGPASPFVIEAAGLTHPGLVRKGNEDAFAVLPELGLFMVADGMGGRAQGAVASRTALQVVQEMIEDPDPTLPDLPEHSWDESSLLVAGVRRANLRILALAESNPAWAGMGTTFAGVLAFGSRIAIAHVGDSRVYRYRDGRLELLTDDHTVAGIALRSGHLSSEAARRVASRHALTRAVGVGESLLVDVRVEEVKPDDVLLICSDGVSGEIDDEEIAAILAVRGANLCDIAVTLILRANEMGGSDNATAVLVRWAAARGG